MIKRKRTTVFAVGAIAVVALAVAGEVWANLAQTPVLTTARSEQHPAAFGTYLTWDQNSAAKPNHHNAFLRNGATTIQLNAAHTYGWGGGIDGTTVVFQQVSLRGQSDIRFYDAVTKMRSAPPAGVNTPAWEWSPSVSGNWLLFGREKGTNNSQVILRSTTSKTSYKLAAENTRNNFVSPGQVNGNWAVWTECFVDHCSVYLRDIAGKVTTKLANTLPPARDEYAPSVSTDGTVYYMHSGRKCGEAVKLVKKAIGQPETILNTFNPGIDVPDTNATADATSGTDVYIQRLNCKANTDDVFRVVDP